MELVCPAGNLPSLKAAVEAGADAVYLGFRDDTNARHFAGLNFNREQLREGVAYAHARGRQVLLAINTYARPEGWARWQQAVDRAVELGVDALIVADMGVLEYVAQRYPEQRLHLSVQASATSVEALRFYQEQFGIRRAVLPRVLSLRQVAALVEKSPVEIEVFGFGSLCVMAEGRCYLSSYVTGESPNTCGACSPARFVDWQEHNDGLHTRLNGVLIDRFLPEEQAGYPTLCKGRFDVCGRVGYAIESPTSLNTLDLLPQLLAAGVAAVKLEGRQRSPAYVARVSRVWREAIDTCCRDPDGYRPRPEWLVALDEVAEGACTTPGAYHRPWQ
ncbi:ubiquinone anaerobic biosynthesis protein UbiU [Thiohalobacter thiocyanaticus]|uniref:Ubiquinone biosynthesis protein UbiU n=1 Tax=Thiohalobacter thiocyanaticus TaxID=585455 RepID=A0A426QJ16_9GAMM|nr:peptidase U32 family protein [Thiohalobacter thiocyanaticus]RRQ21730.1 U32 family peptidase [Thiohalobacter thiocyanaticus]